jgi:hypothetical protein
MQRCERSIPHRHVNLSRGHAFSSFALACKASDVHAANFRLVDTSQVMILIQYATRVDAIRYDSERVRSRLCLTVIHSPFALFVLSARHLIGRRGYYRTYAATNTEESQ